MVARPEPAVRVGEDKLVDVSMQFLQEMLAHGLPSDSEPDEVPPKPRGIHARKVGQRKPHRDKVGGDDARI
jgi:hypothetical protein